jgi:hypothetical protein
MTFTAIPVLNDEAFVERQAHRAMSIPRRTLGANLPIAEPIVELPILRIHSAWRRIGRSKAGACDCQENENSQKNGFQNSVRQNDNLVHTDSSTIEIIGAGCF